MIDIRPTTRPGFVGWSLVEGGGSMGDIVGMPRRKLDYVQDARQGEK